MQSPADEDDDNHLLLNGYFTLMKGISHDPEKNHSFVGTYCFLSLI